MNEETKRLVFTEGRSDCDHNWRDGFRDWEDFITDNGQRVVTAANSGTTRVCTKCGREELTGGTALCPRIPGYQEGGEYTLEADGGLGLFVS